MPELSALLIMLLILAIFAAIPLSIVFLVVFATTLEQKKMAHFSAGRTLSRLIRQFSSAYSALLISGSLMAILIWRTRPYGDRSAGCNFYNALLVGVDCRGFFGAEFVELLVAFPLFVVQLTIVLANSLIGIPFALLIWAPVLISLDGLINWLTKRKAD